MSQRVETEAISIQRYAYAETSQILHFLTRDHGRIGVLARGAYREKNGYEGPVDLLVRGRVQVQFVAGRGLGLLLSRKVEWAYPRLRCSLPRFVAASRLLRILVRCIPVGEGSPECYQLFERALTTLEDWDESRVPLLLLSFDLRLLRILGMSPHLAGCVRCGGTTRLTSFMASEGGMVCQGCLRDPREGLRVERPTWELLQDVGRLRLANVAPPNSRALRRATEVVHRHLQYHLDLPTADVLRMKQLAVVASRG